MLTVIFFALLGLGLTVRLIRKESNKDSSWNWLSYIFGILFGAIIGLIVAGSLTAFLGKRQVEKQEYSRTEIVALVDSNQLSGSFFLASGSIGQDEYYKFYVKTPDGGKQFDSLPARNVIVYEDEGRKGAYISKIQEVKSHPGIKYIFRLLIPSFITSPEVNLTDGYAIHVPKGTILVEENKFRLDMK